MPPVSDPMSRVRDRNSSFKKASEVRDSHPTVFDPHESIGVSADEIVEVVTELQNYRLLGETDEQWDIMGAAYEQYTADEMKKEGGEFFTNRLIVDLLTKMVVDIPEGTMIDPAGGTGGFCSAVLRRMRWLIRKNTKSKIAQERAITNLKDRIFLRSLFKTPIGPLCGGIKYFGVKRFS